MNYKTYLLITFLLYVVSAPASAQNNPYKAPLYWSVYEHHIIKEQNGVSDNYIPESELMANIDWVEMNLKDLGYDMICMDGWGDVSQVNENGYRSSHSQHWQHDFAWWSTHLQSRDMELGMYGNPLWIHVDVLDTTTKVFGTDINVSSLIDPEEEATYFTWVQVNRPGAEEYVKGYIQYYADMGIRYFRVDFLSWFETGYDRYLGTVGPNRPREHYETALNWMREACDADSMFLSLVMPNMFNEAELELQYGHMTRINEDTGYGKWWKFSDKDRGHRFDEWSQYANAFDGFTYWSYIAGRNQIILDGDFIRINTFKTNIEKRSVISAHLMAGGPVTISDQYNTIGEDLWVYQNEEMLALNIDRFVGNPLTNDPTNEASQIWTGQLLNGEWIIGFFNRETETRNRSIDLSDLNFAGEATVRDLWQHAELGSMESISAEIPPHGCMIFSVTEGLNTCIEQSISFDSIDDRVYGDPDFALTATASSGLPVEFEIALGPATVEGDSVHLTGQSGMVHVVAKQSGNDTYCAAFPQVQSFELTGGHQAEMYIGGTFTGWNLSIEMSLEGDLWMANEISIPEGNHELKFANTNDWSGDDWGNATGLTGIAQLTTGGEPNISFTISESGYFDIYFDDLSLEYSIEGPVDIAIETAEIPLQYKLNQNYPNPFNPITTVKFSIPAKTHVNISIFNILGQRIITLIDENKAAGTFQIRWDASNYSTGLYFYQIKTTDFVQTKKLMLVR